MPQNDEDVNKNPEKKVGEKLEVNKFPDDKFYTVYGWMITAGLRGAELLVYAVIYSFRDNPGLVSQSVIAARAGIGSRQVIRILQSLEKENYIKKECQKAGKKCDYVCLVTPDNLSPLSKCHHCQNVTTTPDKMSPPPLSKCQGFSTIYRLHREKQNTLVGSSAEAIDATPPPVQDSDQAQQPSVAKKQPIVLPAKEIEEAWNDVLAPAGFKQCKMALWSDNNKQHLKARTADLCQYKNVTPTKDNIIATWRALFEWIKGSTFLKESTFFDLVWLCKSPDNFRKTIEGNYHHGSAN